MRKERVSSYVLDSHQHHSDTVFLQCRFIQVATLLSARVSPVFPEPVPLRNASTSWADPSQKSGFLLQWYQLLPFCSRGPHGDRCFLRWLLSGPWPFLQGLLNNSLYCPLLTYGFCLLTHLTDRALEDNPVKGPYFSDKHQPEKG